MSTSANTSTNHLAGYLKLSVSEGPTKAKLDRATLLITLCADRRPYHNSRKSFRLRTQTKLALEHTIVKKLEANWQQLSKEEHDETLICKLVDCTMNCELTHGKIFGREACEALDEELEDKRLHIIYDQPLHPQSHERVTHVHSLTSGHRHSEQGCISSVCFVWQGLRPGSWSSVISPTVIVCKELSSLYIDFGATLVNDSGKTKNIGGAVKELQAICTDALLDLTDTEWNQLIQQSKMQSMKTWPFLARIRGEMEGLGNLLMGNTHQSTSQKPHRIRGYNMFLHSHKYNGGSLRQSQPQSDLLPIFFDGLETKGSMRGQTLHVTVSNVKSIHKWDDGDHAELQECQFAATESLVQEACNEVAKIIRLHQPTRTALGSSGLLALNALTHVHTLRVFSWPQDPLSAYSQDAPEETTTVNCNSDSPFLNGRPTVTMTAMGIPSQGTMA